MKDKVYEIYVVKNPRIVEEILRRNPRLSKNRDTLVIELDFFEKQAVVNVDNQILVPINFKHAKRLLS